STTLKVLNNPIDALRTAENLLSKGIDSELGGPRLHQWEETPGQKLSKIYKKGTTDEDTPTINPGEKAWDAILQNWNVVSRCFGMRVDTTQANVLRHEIHHNTPHVNFPTQRRPEKLPSSNDPQGVIDEWFTTTNC
ncbi:hypothetical protein GcM3_205032, partial [Golovinomyces cichoracearum]